MSGRTAVEIIFEGKAPWVVTADDGDKRWDSQALKGQDATELTVVTHCQLGWHVRLTNAQCWFISAEAWQGYVPRVMWLQTQFTMQEKKIYIT